MKVRNSDAEQTILLLSMENVKTSLNLTVTLYKRYKNTPWGDLTCY